MFLAEYHDFEGYVDDTQSVVIAVKIPRRRKTLTVPVDSRVYRRIESLASRLGVPVENLVSSWVREKAMTPDS